jgi:hypothetical protein
MESQDLASFSLLPAVPFVDACLRSCPSALSLAAFYGSVNSFRYLLANGANVTCRDTAVLFSPFGVLSTLFACVLILLHVVVQLRL